MENGEQGGLIQGCVLSGWHLLIILVRWRIETVTTWAIENLSIYWEQRRENEKNRHCFLNENQSKQSKRKFPYILGQEVLRASDSSPGWAGHCKERWRNGFREHLWVWCSYGNKTKRVGSNLEWVRGGTQGAIAVLDVTLLSTLKFTAALFMTAKRWKQPQRTATDERLNKQNGVYTFNRILFSPKKEWNSDTCGNMNDPWRH